MKTVFMLFALLGLFSQANAAVFTRVSDPSQVFDWVDSDGVRVIRVIMADSLGNTAPGESGSTPSAQILLMIGDKNALDIFTKITRGAQTVGQFWAGADGGAPSSLTGMPGVVVVGMPGFIQSINSQRTTLGFDTRTDTYSATGTGAVLTATAKPLKSFALAVKGTGAAPTAFDVRLEVSLDGMNWTQVLAATNIAPGDGGTVWQAVGALTPALYVRTRVAGITLGGASDIVVRGMGLQ